MRSNLFGNKVTNSRNLLVVWCTCLSISCSCRLRILSSFVFSLFFSFLLFPSLFFSFHLSFSIELNRLIVFRSLIILIITSWSAFGFQARRKTCRASCHGHNVFVYIGLIVRLIATSHDYDDDDDGDDLSHVSQQTSLFHIERRRNLRIHH